MAPPFPPGWPAALPAPTAAAAAEALADMERQILGKILQVVSGPGGSASFLRQHLLGRPLAGPSLPLDIGQSQDIPVHLRRLVALGTSTASTPAAATSPRPAANSTTSSTEPTAAAPARSKAPTARSSTATALHPASG